MMTVVEIWQWMGLVVAGVALVAAVAIAWLAILRWLIVIVPAVVLVGFAFERELQLRFTAVLLGVMAILYLPPLVSAWVWRQVTRSRAVIRARITPPPALEMAHQMCADEKAREQDDRDGQARDLERQGAFSLWDRR
jgi:hypothetical protein